MKISGHRWLDNVDKLCNELTFSATARRDDIGVSTRLKFFY